MNCADKPRIRMKMQSLIPTGTFVLFALATLCSVSAQEPGKPATGGGQEFQTAAGAAPISENIKARDEVARLLEKEGWQEGANTKADRTIFFVAAGYGAINAPRSHPRFADSRAIAFEKAILDAKARTAQFIRETIETRAIAMYSEGQSTPLPTAPLNAGDPPPLGMLDKLVLLAHKKLDDMLRKEGIAKEAPQAKEAAEKLRLSDGFQKFTRTASQAYIAGLQSFQTFEVFPDGKSGEIAVVGIVSDKLLMMGAALAGGKPPPLQKPNIPIAQQLANSPVELLCSFGVRQMVDERGQLVLVAYGQSQPISESTRAEQAAEEKARLQALGALRSFAGEVVTTARDSVQAESYKEFEDNTSVYANASAFRERNEAVGKAMSISGIQTVKRWNQKHPLSGQMVVGTVLVWSPQSAAVAAQFGDKMEGRKTASIPSRTDSTNRIPVNADQKGQFKGQGKKGDKDGF